MAKILIIEDEDILGNLLLNKLIEQGYDAQRAVNGEVGVEKVKEFNPDLILLDIIMPKMNGFEFLEQIRLIDEYKNLPIIIISNSGQPVEIERAKQLGVTDWLIKTEFNPEEVIEKVKKQLATNI